MRRSQARWLFCPGDADNPISHNPVQVTSGKQKAIKQLPAQASAHPPCLADHYYADADATHFSHNDCTKSNCTVDNGFDDAKFKVMLALWQDLVSELENERTNRVIAQQTANQERLQARASAAESASLRRQLHELSQQMEQERRAAAAARLQAQKPASAQTSQVCKVITVAQLPILSFELLSCLSRAAELLS